jgi:hypothetical protein
MGFALCILFLEHETMMYQFDDADDARDHARMMADDGPDECEPGICPTCNGSGEGMTDGSVCPTCKGEGEC